MPRPRASRALENVARRLGFVHVAGVDEVGRGCLAGPVVAAAAILRPGSRLPGLRDSKLLTPMARARLAPMIKHACLAWGIAAVMPASIDRWNIRVASFLAMRRALARLAVRPDHVIVDGFPIPRLDMPQTGLIKADRRCRTVAAASVLAKVARDRRMDRYHRRFPEYGFDHNRGYSTSLHLEALERYGPTPLHRRSFQPVRRALFERVQLPIFE
jgi:ribonuclease HII